MKSSFVLGAKYKGRVRSFGLPVLTRVHILSEKHKYSFGSKYNVWTRIYL